MTKKFYTVLQLCVGLSIFVAILEAGNNILEKLSHISMSGCRTKDPKAESDHVYTSIKNLWVPASASTKNQAKGV
ncbi:MAG: hypothetical protein J7599_14680 [Niabella sp.]|nr:hypothetical protein [Niabella sp.]